MKVPNTEENLSKCICGGCPTFYFNLLRGGFFCALDKVDEAPDEQRMQLSDVPSVY